MYQVRVLSPGELRKLASEKPQSLLEILQSKEVIIAKNYFPKQDIMAIRARTYQWGLDVDPSWHPLLENCPDYHRVVDDPPMAFLKSRMHLFLHHGWHEENNKLFDYFSDVFWMKSQVGGFPRNAYLRQTPSQGLISRVQVHHYPKGGGYIKEHYDHVAPFALFQAMIPAFTKGQDFSAGGLYVRDENNEILFLDDQLNAGDLVLMSTNNMHGVAPVDPEDDYDWKLSSGRWSIVPLIVESDYNKDRKKPVEL